jgi:hypothetical protein
MQSDVFWVIVWQAGNALLTGPAPGPPIIYAMTFHVLSSRSDFRCDPSCIMHGEGRRDVNDRIVWTPLRLSGSDAALLGRPESAHPHRRSEHGIIKCELEVTDQVLTRPGVSQMESSDVSYPSPLLSTL